MKAQRPWIRAAKLLRGRGRPPRPVGDGETFSAAEIVNATIMMLPYFVALAEAYDPAPLPLR